MELSKPPNAGIIGNSSSLTKPASRTATSIPGFNFQTEEARSCLWAAQRGGYPLARISQGLVFLRGRKCHWQRQQPAVVDKIRARPQKETLLTYEKVKPATNTQKKKIISSFTVTSVSPGPRQDGSMRALGHLQCQHSCLVFPMHLQPGEGDRESPCSLELVLIFQLQLRVMAPSCSFHEQQLSQYAGDPVKNLSKQNHQLLLPQIMQAPRFLFLLFLVPFSQIKIIAHMNMIREKIKLRMKRAKIYITDFLSIQLIASQDLQDHSFWGSCGEKIKKRSKLYFAEGNH